MSQQIDYIKVRSFLMSNVENLLESVSHFRHSNLITSNGLFFESPTDPKVKLDKKYTLQSKRDILVQEKDSLGLYVSGKPLGDYLELETFVQDSCYRDDIHVVLINKIKKIFTKKNTMMFALLVSTPKAEYEAIIFPKKALELSPLLIEKEVYWVVGKIEEGKKTETTKQDQNGVSVEYEQKPKILIENLVSLDGDLIGMLNSGKEKLAGSSVKHLQSLNIQDFLDVKNSADTSVPVTKTVQSSKATNTFLLKIPNSLEVAKVQKIKSLLSKTQNNSSNNLGKIIVEVQLANGDWKKAKGKFWGDIEDIKKLL